MSWICPNCSNSNDEEQMNCFVCGMDRPISSMDSLSDEEDCRIFFSDFEAFKESVKEVFMRRTNKRTTSESSEMRSATYERDEEPYSRTVEVSKGGETLFESDYAKPWPEHRIKFDFETIRAKGYIRSEQKCMGGVNGYSFYKEDGSVHFIRQEILLIQKMAYKV